MNSTTQRSLMDARDIPITKPAEPLPAIFSTERRSGFSTAPRVRRTDGRESQTESQRNRQRDN